MATTQQLATWPCILPGRIRMWPLVATSGTVAAIRSSISNSTSHVSDTHQLQAITSLSSHTEKVPVGEQVYAFLFSDPASVRLSVLPSRSSSIPLTLSCDVESFYREDVSVTFLQNGTVLPNPPGTEELPGGLYATRHYYTLSSRQREQGGLVQCVVHQPGVEHPVSSSANLDTLEPKGRILGQTNQHW